MTDDDERALEWLAPWHRDEPNALAFAKLLRERSIWPSVDDFNGYAWDCAVPPREHWDREISEFNANLESTT